MTQLPASRDAAPPDFTMDEAHAEIARQDPVDVDWDEIDRKLEGVGRPGPDNLAWQEYELAILERARAKGYTLGQIVDSGILPGRTKLAMETAWARHVTGSKRRG